MSELGLGTLKDKVKAEKLHSKVHTRCSINGSIEKTRV